jgi:hypothetical protein
MCDGSLRAAQRQVAEVGKLVRRMRRTLDVAPPKRESDPHDPYWSPMRLPDTVAGVIAQARVDGVAR